MAFEQTETFYDRATLTVRANRNAIPGVGANSPDDVVWDAGWARLWQDAPASPGEYYSASWSAITLNEVDQRCEQTLTWTEWTPQQKRDSILANISQQRIAADVSQIDIRADRGRVVLMDEANSEAEKKTNALAATDDADLDAFDYTFDPQQIGSIATAKSLYEQTTHVLNNDPSLTAQQRADLEAVQASYATIATGTDDAAEVPAVPDDSRLKIGVVAEGYGSLKVRRFDGQDGFWWLEFELKTDRELSVADYWVAVYSEGTYLTTSQLTQTGPDTYVADKLAVNLPHTPPKQYEYTLCHQHISNPQFTPVVLAADENEAIALIRWGGSATGGAAAAQQAGTTWEDTGQTVTYVGSNLVRIGSTAGFSVGDIIRFNEQPAEFVVNSVHSSIDLILDAQPPQTAVGDTVYRKA